jgi:hypothetical protein
MNKTMCEGFSYYLPYTFEQFTETFNGRPQEGIITQDDESEKKPNVGYRSACILELIARIPFTPFDATIRTIWNGGKTCSKVIEWFSITLMLPFKFSECKKKWGPVTYEMIDRALMTALSPFQATLKNIRMFIAIFFPKTFYVLMDSLVEKRRVVLENYAIQMQIRNLVPNINDRVKALEDDGSYEEAANLLILFNCFRYSWRWDVLIKKDSNPLEEAFSNMIRGRCLWRNNYPIEERVKLLNSFENVFNKENIRSLTMNKSDLVKFFKDHFNTPILKSLLANFLSKSHSNFVFRTTRYYNYQKRNEDLKIAFINVRRYFITELHDLNLRDKLQKRYDRCQEAAKRHVDLKEALEAYGKLLAP